MSAAHTPGPWRVSGKATINGGRGWIASVSTLNRNANARLIAAAPELLEALEQIAWLSTNHGGWFEQDEFGEYVKLGSIAQAAIAKTRGEP